MCEEVSFTYRRGAREPSASQERPVSANVARGVSVGARGGPNLVYWKPHKTRSSSMRAWMNIVSEKVGTEMIGLDVYYPYSPFIDHERRANFLRDGVSCAFVTGHIRIPRFSERFDERRMGAVVTTTRDALNTLASKFFHRTDGVLSPRALRSLRTVRSTPARRWFYYWHDSNPCEPLEYYDGLKDCRLDGGDVEKRAREIADRMDCVVDTDDPDDDIRALCSQMGVSKKECPGFPERKVAKGRSLYDDLYDISHVKQVLKNNFYVTDVLRKQLMPRRCRFLASGNLTSSLGPARWPTVSCLSQTKSN